MLKLIALNFTVMLNVNVNITYSQWLNIRGKTFPKDISSIGISETNILYLCFYNNLKLECKLLQYISILKNFNVRWD